MMYDNLTYDYQLFLLNLIQMIKTSEVRFDASAQGLLCGKPQVNKLEHMSSK